jgi:hypothetical protein
MVSVAGTHSCAVTTGGRAWCWGYGMDGALGVREAPDRCGQAWHKEERYGIMCARSPVRVETDEIFTTISAARHHACALTEKGEAWCWGAGVAGRLVQGDMERVSVPRRAPGPPRGSRYLALSSGADRTCATTPAGEVHCWRFTLATLGDLDDQAWSTKYFLKQAFVILLFAWLGWRLGGKRQRPLLWAILGAVVGIIAASLWFAWDLLTGLSRIK